MSKESDNKAIVGRWFTDFWGATCNLNIVDELAAPDMLLQYSLHEPRRGRDDIKAFMTDFRKAFPDLNFWGAADLIAEGDYVVGRWEGGGTHTGPAFGDFLAGSLPANTGRKMRFTGTTVLKLKDGKIVEEIGLGMGAVHRNEYDSHLAHTAELLLADADSFKIAAYVRQVVRANMPQTNNLFYRDEAFSHDLGA
jgi:predicted ester cyclase